MPGWFPGGPYLLADRAGALVRTPIRGDGWLGLALPGARPVGVLGGVSWPSRAVGRLTGALPVAGPARLEARLGANAATPVAGAAGVRVEPAGELWLRLGG